MRTISDIQDLHYEFWASVKGMPGVKTTSIRGNSKATDQVDFVLYVDDNLIDLKDIPRQFKNIHVLVEKDVPAYSLSF